MAVCGISETIVETQREIRSRGCVSWMHTNPGYFKKRIGMADPSHYSSLDVFLDFDFTSQHAPVKYLGVAKSEDHDPYLIALDKHDKQTKKKHHATLALKNVVRFVLKHYDSWMQECGERLPRLEHQLAWLERKVKERNIEPLKRDIDFKNPARWKLNVKIIFAEAFDAHCQELLISKYFQSTIPFDRLTPQKTIHDICWRITQQELPLKVKCMLNKCCVLHTLQVCPAELFTYFIYEHESLSKESSAPFLSDEEPGEHQTLTIEAKTGNTALLLDLIQNLHQSTRALKSSSRNSNANSQSSRISSSSSSYQHACGLRSSSESSRLHSTRED